MRTIGSVSGSCRPSTSTAVEKPVVNDQSDSDNSNNNNNDSDNDDVQYSNRSTSVDGAPALTKMASVTINRTNLTDAQVFSLLMIC